MENKTRHRRYWSRISGFPVVTAEGRTTGESKILGRLHGVFLDPERGHLIGFLVGYTRILVLTDLEKWEPSCVQVSSQEALAPVFDILRIQQFGARRCFLNGKKVYSKSGKRLGRVRDFSFDTGANTLLDFEVSKEFLWLEWDKRDFRAEDIAEITEKGIVLNLDSEEKEKVKKPVQVTAAT